MAFRAVPPRRLAACLLSGALRLPVSAAAAGEVAIEVEAIFTTGVPRESQPERSLRIARLRSRCVRSKAPDGHARWSRFASSRRAAVPKTRALASRMVARASSCRRDPDRVRASRIVPTPGESIMLKGSRRLATVGAPSWRDAWRRNCGAAMAMDGRGAFSVERTISALLRTWPILGATAALPLLLACGTERTTAGASSDGGLAEGAGSAFDEFGSSDASSKAPPCASGGSNAGGEVAAPNCVPDSGDEPTRRDDGSVESRSPDSGVLNDAASTQPGDRDGALDAVACETDAGRCDPGEYCVDQVFYGNYLGEPDGAFNPPPPSHSYSCCRPDAGPGCPGCQISGEFITCTTRAVCAAADTPIATADGERRISSLRPGQLVYSADRGSLRLVPLLQVAKTRVFHHQVVELVLANGETLRMSAGHPTADGRLLEQIQVGDRLDGIPILSSRQVPYADSFTYDILPASETHTYVAGGVLVGSTLVDRSCASAP
jgi:hypothetical protein